MKKIFSIFVCAVFLLTNFLCIAFATEKPIIYSTVETANAGESLRLPILIDNNIGIMGFKLNFSYDSSILTPVSVEYGDTIDYGLQDNIEGDAAPGGMCVYWSGTQDVIAEGIWFYINFDVNSQSKGETEINISFSQADTFNENFDDVVLKCSPVKLTIANTTYTQDATFSLSASDFSAGESFKLNINVDDITVSGTSFFTIPYNSQLFEYDGLITDGVKASIENTGEELLINVSNLDVYDAGKSILQLTFKSSENIVGGMYEFSAAVFLNSVEAYCSSCSVWVTGGDKSGTVIYAEDFYALPGDTVEIPVNISNNTGIMGFRLAFRYNSDLLTPVSVAKGSVLTVGTLNDSITETNTGSFDVLWNYTENFTANGELLLLTFTVNEEASFSTSDIKVSYTQGDTFDESYADLKLICNDIEGAITNLRPVHKDTVIKPTSKYIYSETTACSDIGNMLSTTSGTTLSGKPNSYGFYGTGTMVAVKSADIITEEYMIIINGDVNGDSACDVLDVASLEIALNKNEAFTQAELEAIDFNGNDNADITDYQSLVNYILS